MSLKVTGVYFSASSAGAGPGKMKATIRASRLNGSAPTAASAVEANANINNIVNSPLVCNKTASVVASHSQSLDYLHMNFEEKRQIIASSLSLVDFLHPPKVKGKRCSHHRSNLQTSLMNPSSAIFSFFFFCCCCCCCYCFCGGLFFNDWSIYLISCVLSVGDRIDYLIPLVGSV